MVNGAAVIAMVLFGSARARADCNNSTTCESITQSGSGFAIEAAAPNGTGIYVTGGSGSGQNAIYAQAFTTGDTIYANNANTGNGVHGSTANGNGVLGNATNTGVGVYGASSGGTGTAGVAFGTNQNGVTGLYYNSSGSGVGVYGSSGSTSGYAGYFSGNLAYTGSLSHVSDQRLKKNIKPIEQAVDQVLKLHGVTFEWKDQTQQSGPGMRWGFIAQDVEKVFPAWVKEDPKSGFKIVDTTGVEPLLVESIRSLKAENDQLKRRIQAVESRTTSSAGLNGDFGNSGLIGLGLASIACAIGLSKRRNSA